MTLEGTGHELLRADWPAILEAVEQHTALRLQRPQSMHAAPGAGDEHGSVLVRDLRPEEVPEAVAVLARGMRDNPCT